jgi:hypothetical protein
MKGVELYAQVRYAVQIEGIIWRETARRLSPIGRIVSAYASFAMVFACIGAERYADSVKKAHRQPQKWATPSAAGLWGNHRQARHGL